MLQSYKHLFNLPPHLLNCVKTCGIVGILGFKIKFIWLNLNRFEQIGAVDNLTKLHLSMSKSWLTPDYLFFCVSNFLNKHLEAVADGNLSIAILILTIVKYFS